jgi:hypothetical protein
MPEVPTRSTTTVVRVKELFKVPQVLHLLAGKTITVVTAGPDDLEVGQELVFAGRGALYGESLVVVEETRVVGPVDSASISKRIRGEVQAAHDRALLERIVTASMIVAGAVSRSENLPRDPLKESEHSPQWAQFTIEVDSVAKGNAAARRLAAYYPQSTDIKWHLSPKFEVGQEGVWLLRDEPIAEIGGTGLTALDPLDFHTLRAYDHIESLARGLC